MNAKREPLAIRGAVVAAVTAPLMVVPALATAVSTVGRTAVLVAFCAATP